MIHLEVNFKSRGVPAITWRAQKGAGSPGGPPTPLAIPHAGRRQGGHRTPKRHRPRPRRTPYLEYTTLSPSSVTGQSCERRTAYSPVKGSVMPAPRLKPSQ